MISIDDPFNLDGKTTTIRTLAMEGRITKWHSRSFSAHTGQTRQGFFADLDGKPAERMWEISKSGYQQLKELGIGDTPSA